jgi:CubicO group peptidase (beta-lactamase class C family)
VPAPLLRLGAPALACLLALTACSGAGDSPGSDGAAAAAAGAADTTAPPTSATSSPDAAVALSPEGYPAQPDGVAFPTLEWEDGDLPPEADRAAIDGAAEAAFAGAGADGRGVRSVVVVQGGRIVYEAYRGGFGPDSVFPSWSVAKTFTAALVGLVVTDGLIDVADDGLREEWPADDPRAAITIEELLRMTSGLAWAEGPDGYREFFAQPDAAAWFATRELAAEPGTRFNYATPETALLARETAEALGGCAEQEAYLEARLLGPIGITTQQMIRDASGCWFGGLGMNMVTRDFARFGLLLVRGGLWDGEQLLDPAWIDAMRVPSPAFDSYGYQTWLVDGGEAFAARGFEGQLILMVPDDDIVIAINNADGNDCPLVTTVLEELGSDLAAC